MIKTLNLQNFRSYNNKVFEFSPSVNIIHGPNGSGKTNLLEAIYIISRGNSYRAKDLELIRHNSNEAIIKAGTFTGRHRTTTISKVNRPTKKHLLNDKIVNNLTLDAILPTVVFEPDHLQIVYGGPENRREYIDDILEQTISGYSKILNQYKRTLLQRNTLLKKGNNSQNQLFIWNIKLSQLGGNIVKERIDITSKINEKIKNLYKTIASNNDEIVLTYKPLWPLEIYESSMLRVLEKNYELDKARGYTGSGPHREDLLVKINNRTASPVISRGEARTIVLSLKLTELIELEKSLNTKPILLLDDIFSELDINRRKKIIKYLDNNQTFITAADDGMIAKNQKANYIDTTKL